jgi:DNA-binding transcriptional MerR regulator
MGRRFPLLLRSGRLLSRESLPSFAVRLAQLNFYDPVTIMHRLCLEGVKKDRLDWPSRGETYDRLFELSWVDVYALHDATGHCFARALTPPGVEIASLQIPNGGKLSVLPQEIARKHLRPSSAAQFCPVCLKKALYHRVTWMPVAAAVCITHKRLLVDRCPGCQAKVPVRAIVEDGRCRRCGTDLTKARSPRIANDSLGLDSQRFIRWWLGISRRPVNPARYGPLTQLNPRLLLFLVEGLVDSIRLLGSDWSYMHQPATGAPREPFERISGKPTPDQSYRLYATAFKALVDWPQGFHEFLQAYTSRDGKSSRSGVLEDMGRLYSKWIDDRWKVPAFSFVQGACTRHLVDTYVASSSTPRQPSCLGISGSPQAPTFVGPVRAARLLEVSVRTIKRLVDAGFLVKYAIEHGEPHRYGFVRRDEVLILRLAWRKGISLEEAAKWLGLTRSVVVDLVRVGLLTAECDPNVDGSSQWMFSKQDLDRCYCEVTARARSPGRGYSSLPEAARALSACGLRVADILKLVVDGQLECWSHTQSPALAKLTFTISDVATLLKRPWQGVRLLDGEEAAHRLGVESWTLSRWVGKGLLSPTVRYAYEAYFDPEEIDRFLADHIPSKEAAEMLGLGVKEMEMWHWHWGLRAAKGTGMDKRDVYFFPREDVERLRSEFLAAS